VTVLWFPAFIGDHRQSAPIKVHVLSAEIQRLCTWLKEAGVDLRDAQALMRHSDPKLTSNIYTDIRLKDLRKAVERMDEHGSGSFNLALLAFNPRSLDRKATG